MSIAKKNRKLGSSTWTSAGWNLAPDLHGLCSPSKGVFSCCHLLVPLSCSGMGTATDACCQEGIFSMCSFFLPISVSASSPHCVLLILLKGKHFLGGTDLSRPSKVTAGICDYLMGLADYEKACLLLGSWERDNGQVDAWICLNYAWNPDGHFGKATSTDQMGGCRPGLEHQASKQGSLWIVLPICRGLRVKYFSRGRWEKPSHIAHSQDKCLTIAVFLLDQTALLQNSFAASVQTEPRGILTDSFCC